MRDVSLFKCFSVVLVFPILCVNSSIGYAQEEQPTGPIYIVQSGDTLWSIAQRFRISIDDLSSINNITNPNQLYEGTELIIPGLEGVTGILTTKTVAYGESLRSLSRQYHVAMDIIAKLNHLVSPMELYAGSSLVLPEMEESAKGYQRILITRNQSVLEAAVLNKTNPWDLILLNKMDSSAEVIPGDLLLTSEDGNHGPIGLPEEIISVTIDPSPPLQGKTMVFRLDSKANLSIRGSFLGKDLHFFRITDNGYLALQGVHALTEPGIYPLGLELQLENGAEYQYSQMVDIAKVDYPYDKPLKVDESTIDPNITKPEDDLWYNLASAATETKFWQDAFKLPSPLSQTFCIESGDCWSSRFGNRRSYNGSAYIYYHTGLDIVGRSGTEIYAPSPGMVVYAGPLTIRGNATLIDHGWGVYSGYLHQSEILVKVGEKVETGQLIGLVGNTGRVEGPHLHWEIMVGGIPVDPLDWLNRVYP